MSTIQYKNSFERVAHWFTCLALLFVSVPSHSQFASNPLSVAVDDVGHEYSSFAPAFRPDSSTFTLNGSSARSAPIDNNGISLLSVEIVGGGTISFDWRVSSERNFDFLSFLVLDQNFEVVPGLEALISGSQDWTRRSFTLPPGRHFVSWAYLKDISLSAGEDAGWVDNIVAPGSVKPITADDAATIAPIIGLLLFDDEDSDDGSSSSPPRTELIPEQTPLESRGPFVVLESEVGDSIGQGERYEYSPSNAVIFLTFSPLDNLIQLSVELGDSSNSGFGSENWFLFMQIGFGEVVAGEYKNATRFPFNGPVGNGLSFEGQGRGCNQLNGSFFIKEIALSANGSLEKLFADFEQFCDGSSSAMRGSIQYDLSLPE